jgi:N-acetylmuramoyl-L-alanine amidase
LNSSFIRATLRRMKFAAKVMLLFFAVLPFSVFVQPAAAVQVQTADFAGRRYVRLEDWAHAARFDFRWIDRENVMQLTNRSCAMTFQKDSHNLEFNGINVLLCYPVVVQNGSGWLAESDFQQTLAPLFVTPTNPAGARIHTIVIDPGHGGKDPGIEVGSHQEKKYTLLLAEELRDQLKRAGFNASLTRTRDVYVEKSDRPEIAHERGADLFISLHWNGTTVGKNDVKGVQTYCLTPSGAASSNSGDDVSDVGAKPGNRNDRQNLLLAYDLQKSLTQNLDAEDRGVRRARFAVLCDAQMPAVLIEGGYMTHPEESKRIYDPEYRRRMAAAIVSGVLAYKRQVEPAPPAPVNLTNPPSSSGASR